MNIVYVFADALPEWDRSERRCAIPARALNRTGLHSATMIGRGSFIAGGGEAVEACQAADLIVVQGSLAGRALKAVQHWRARDKAVIVDIDRAEHLLRPGREKPAAARGDASAMRMSLKLVHAATTPSRRLAADCQEWAPIFHLPSYIEPDRYYYPGRQPDGRVVIGWRGDSSYLEAFACSGVAEALRGVCRARPQVRVVMCSDDNRLRSVLDLPPAQLDWRPWAPFAEWPGLLAGYDIGIAPLYGEYDQRRSWSQALEYMIQRIPWVASAGPAFQDLAQFGWLVNNQAQVWERVLLDMVDHLDDYRLEAEHDAYLFAISQSIDENLDKVIDIYSQIATRAAGSFLSC